MRTVLLIGAVAALWAISFSSAGVAEKAVAIPAIAADAKEAGNASVAVFAGGCFWGMEGVFEHVDDDLLRAEQGLDGLFDQVLTRLHQALNGHIVGDAFLLNEAAVEAELRVRGGGEPDFDFLETALHQRVEHLQFLGDIHRTGRRRTGHGKAECRAGLSFYEPDAQQCATGHCRYFS